jgi:chromate transporter
MSEGLGGQERSDRGGPVPATGTGFAVDLGLTFNHIALASFGGGLSAWSREVLVVEKKWMGENEFLSAMTMCRILPGANQVNMAVFVGTKMRGFPER